MLKLIIIIMLKLLIYSQQIYLVEAAFLTDTLMVKKESEDGSIKLN